MSGDSDLEIFERDTCDKRRTLVLDEEEEGDDEELGDGDDEGQSGRDEEPSSEEGEGMEDEDEEDEEDTKPSASKSSGMVSIMKRSRSDSGVGKEAVSTLIEYRDYEPEKMATWKHGSPTPYIFLAKVLHEIRNETKRLKITRILANAFRTVLVTTPGDLVYCVYLCSNQLAPAHHGLELGIGESTLIRAIAEATGRKQDSIKSEYHQTGDLGDVAQNAKAKQKVMFPPPPLTVKMVYDNFLAIAKEAGSRSQDKKRGRIQKLLVSAKEEEPGYIIRSLQGKLRIGLATQTILVAIAHAFYLQSSERPNLKREGAAMELEDASQQVKKVFSECPDYDKLISALISDGIKGFWKNCKFTIGIPVRPMLAKPTTGVTEVLERFSGCQFTCEYKYDGERAQIHIMQGGKVKIYSRNAEDTTAKYLDVAALIPSHLKEDVKEAVIDSEIVAFDREKHEILPFQILSTRSKKETDINNIKVQVCVFAFDCLYVNGEPLLQKTLEQRREALYRSMREEPGKLEFAKFKTSNDVEELQDFLTESVDAKTEGLIVKTLTENATYEPSKRSFNWLKLKKDYVDGLGDSLDLVVIGAWYGKGKRTGYYGAFLLACYDEDTEEFQSVCKLGTGLSDDDLQNHSQMLKHHVADGPKSYYRYGESLAPDVWFEAHVVWEVKAADLSISPVHKAGAGAVDSSKGISLRFPRLLRQREDKSAEMATTSSQIVDMYRAQSLRREEQGPKMDEEDYW